MLGCVEVSIVIVLFKKNNDSGVRIYSVYVMTFGGFPGAFVNCSPMTARRARATLLLRRARATLLFPCSKTFRLATPTLGGAAWAPESVAIYVCVVSQ